jgi:hypothetical protein
MARQTSLFKLEGSLGDFCFYKTEHGYMVRRKSSLSARRVKTDPAYERARQNAADFKRAAHAVKLFRSAFNSLLEHTGDKRMTGRLMSTMIKVIHADAVNPCGQRTVKDGEPVLFEGFQLNGNFALGKALHASFSADIDRASGRMIVDIPAFSPETGISSPAGATHFRLFSAGAAIDFQKDTYDGATAETAYLPVGRKSAGPILLHQKVKPDTSCPFFLLLGIEFVKVINEEQILLRDGSVNALAVVRVAHR